MAKVAVRPRLCQVRSCCCCFLASLFASLKALKSVRMFFHKDCNLNLTDFDSRGNSWHYGRVATPQVRGANVERKSERVLTLGEDVLLRGFSS